MTDFPCHYCTTDRYPGCHSHCEKYIKTKAEHDKRREELKLESQITNYTVHEVIKNRDAEAMRRKKGRRYFSNPYSE